MIIHNHEYLMWLVFTISVLGFLVFVFDSGVVRSHYFHYWLFVQWV